MAEGVALVHSDDESHPANQIPRLCALSYNQGWAVGTAGGVAVQHDSKIYLTPSGVQKELIKPADLFVAPATECFALELADPRTRVHQSKLPYVYAPNGLKPTADTPIFMTILRARPHAQCVLHTHAHHAVLLTLLLEPSRVPAFEISRIEQIKGVPRGPGEGNLGYDQTLRIPIIENRAVKEDLTGDVQRVLDENPETCAVLVRRHGLYVWGDNPVKTKIICECLDSIFKLAVDMKAHGIPWTE